MYMPREKKVQDKRECQTVWDPNIEQQEAIRIIEKKHSLLPTLACSVRSNTGVCRKDASPVLVLVTK